MRKLPWITISATVLGAGLGLGYYLGWGCESS
jgi:hypothetical protein